MIVARRPRRCGFLPSPVGAAAVVDVVIISAEEEEEVVVVVDVAECCEGGGRNDGASAVGATATFLSSPASFVKPPLAAAPLASPTPDDDCADFFLDMNLFHMIVGGGETDTRSGGERRRGLRMLS